MSLVERRDLRLGQSLGRRHDARLDDPEGEVGVAGLQRPAAGKVGTRRRLDPDRSSGGPGRRRAFQVTR